MSKLFESININESISLKNRIIMSPMCQYSSEDGFPNDWHFQHYVSRAVGNVSAIIQEATAVVAEGRISYGDLGIWKDEHIEAYQKLTSEIKKYNCVPGIQLAHAGRKASTEKPWLGHNQIKSDEKNGWKTVSSSNLPFNESDEIPHQLTISEIKDVVKEWGKATDRAIKAGFEILEIHGAHGYLVHQFLSPLINNRTDEYGGSFENRIRFVLEIVEEMQKYITTQSLWIRLSASDWAENGWNLDETIELCKILKQNGVEVIDVSSGGGVSHQKIDVKKNYQVPFANEIKNQVEIITGAVGLIFEPKQAEEILQNNEADLIFLGRELLRDPYFALCAAKELEEDIKWLPQYERAKNNHYA
ncbi:MULTISPECIES: NADH:flavin oxidoreductase/NADH oxidase [Empedobacter]|uniref:NADH:flavin oxidoreductase/NADH oxidase n=1 Tax=Empedobacter falsenii TaxID=343874 RepID=A0A7H9DTS4_9FLAO|nr:MULTISPECIES: NADH:flavin oxidoreductase/NADH oxidase [Empedobacter]MDH2207967.1 NADH:flavin oxidoreductase/NADH oxidase [Empedobacter sp. GD03644]QLL58445.1 NADH:flavin oxidoreductase/NADH oxidase [Empedobacter falsenii]